jgi:hypothetical protein
MNAGVGSLPYFGLVVGELIAFVAVVLTNGSYVKKLKANNNVPVPEWRLPLVMAGEHLYSQQACSSLAGLAIRTVFRGSFPHSQDFSPALGSSRSSCNC